MSALKIPIHPGEILADELEEIGMTAAACERLDMPNRLHYSADLIEEIGSVSKITQAFNFYGCQRRRCTAGRH